MMSCININDSFSDGLLPYSDPPHPPLASSDHYHELSANNSCNNNRLSFLVPLISFDQPSPTPSFRKRRAVIDLADYELSQNDGWRLDEISSDLQDQMQLINGDILQDHVLIDDDYAQNTSANHDCSDLEGFLNFLLMESPHENSLCLSGLDWECDLNDSSNQVESNGDPSCGFQNYWEVETEEGGENRASWQQKQGGEVRASWEQKQDVEIRASWQQKQGDDIRASWQEEQDGEIRASWQQKQGDEIRASWQQKQDGEIRSSWQPQSEQGRCREGGALSQLEDVGPVRGSTTAVWAGPTLMDIESAFAMSGSPTHNNTSKAISSDSSTASSTLGELVHQQEKITSFFDVKKMLTDEQEELLKQDKMGSWRLKLQKRHQLEPKHTVKVRSEEDDGYKWRKYGQKRIKNSPFPRSYYRCSYSGKCSAKKQVERCHEDGGLYNLVTYEGIHLHHRPNPLRKIGMLVEHEDEKKKKKPLLTCSPSSPTCGSTSILPINNPSHSNVTLLSQSLPLSPSTQLPTTCTPQHHQPSLPRTTNVPLHDIFFPLGLHVS